jgi:hypothetical protein
MPIAIPTGSVAISLQARVNSPRLRKIRLRGFGGSGMRPPAHLRVRNQDGPATSCR